MKVHRLIEALQALDGELEVRASLTMEQNDIADIDSVIEEIDFDRKHFILLTP